MNRTIPRLLSAIIAILYLTAITPNHAYAQCNAWIDQGNTGVSDNSGSGARIAVDGAGNIYMVYASDPTNRIKVKKYDGTSWSLLDTGTFSHGRFPQIALDGSGVPYVAYTDMDAGEKPVVKKYNGSTWTTVGGTNASDNQGWFLSLRIDASGNPWLSFLDIISGYLSCVKYSGSTWEDISPTSRNGWWTSMALDPSGMPYIATIKEDGKGVVVHYNGSSWDLVGADGFTVGYMSETFSLAVDGSGVPYMSLIDAGVGDELLVMKFNGSSWVNVGEGIPNSHEGSIAIDASGSPYLAYLEGIAVNRWRIRKFDGSNWVTVGNGFVPVTSPAANSIVISSSNIPYVVYSGPTLAYEPVVKKLVTVSTAISGTTELCTGATTTLSNSTAGGSWESTACDLASANAATGVVTALAPGNPVIHYNIGGCAIPVMLTVNPFAGNIIGDRTLNAGSTISMSSTGSGGGTWNSSNTSVATVSTGGVVSGVAEGTAVISYTIAGACGTAVATAIVSVNAASGTCQVWNKIGNVHGFGYNDHIAFDRSGTAYLAIADYDYESKATVKKLVAGSWINVGTPGFSEASVLSYGGLKLAVQPDGTPFVAYMDGAHDNKLTVKKFNGSSWVTLGSPGFTTFGVWNIAIAVSACGTPYVTMQGSEGVMMFDGSSWISIAQNALASADPIDIAVGNDNVPYMLYEDNVDGKISVARYVNSEWETVGAARFSADGADRAKIAVGKGGDVYAAYTTYSDQSLVVMKYGGAGWATVGSIGASGVYGLSLDVDKAGTPYVCYDNSASVASNAVLRYRSGAWEQVAAANFANSGVQQMALSADGVPHAIFAEYDAGELVLTVVKPGNFSSAISGVTTIEVGDATYLTSVSRPGIWSSSDPSIAESVDSWIGGVANGTATISYASGSCVATVVVTVGTPCSIAPIAGVGTLCVGGTTTFTNSTAGGTWYSTDESIATVGETNGIVTAVSVGLVDISYVAGSCTVSKALTVDAPPSAGTITGTVTVCTGNTTTLSNATTGGAWSSSNAAVATVGSSSGIVSGITAGNTTITYTVTNSCGSATTTQIVTVNTAPSAGTITGTTTVCTGNTTTLSNATTGGTWSSGNSAIATVGSSSGIVSGVAAGNATITYTVTSGCGSATTTKNITVNATPSAGTITGTATVCTGNTTTLSNAVTGGAWSSSNTAIATVGAANGVVSGVAAGNAAITYTVANGCGSATATKVVTVNAATSAGTITGSGSICTGATSTLSNAVTGGTWSSSNTAIASVGSTTGIVTGVSTGNATITYTVSGSCGTATATTIVTVGATASVTGSLALCAGMTSTLSGGASGGTWTSSNTAVATIGATSGVLTAVATGTANITYVLGSGCIATAVATVSQPAIIAGTSNTCVGQTAMLTDATTGGTWSSSNTALATVDATTGVVTGVAAGTTTISYIVSTGCYRTIAFTVKALPPAIAGPVTVCEGATAYVPPPSSNGQSWTSSNTSVATIGSSTGMLTGVSAGTTILTYTTVTGCYVTTEATVTAAPAAITGTTALCAGSTSSLGSATSGGSWSGSNTSVATVGSATGVLTAVNAGTAMITYSTGACRTTTIATVSPIAAITGTPGMCVGSSATLSNSAAGGTWSSSNTSIATVGTSGIVTGITAGNATITYTLASGCSRTVVATVVATPGAITGTLTVCPGATTALGSSTPGGAWGGGNASIATINATTGVVTGVGAGTINVSYTLTGCRTTAIATVNPLPAVIAGTANACVAQTSTLNSATPGGAWTSNNTSVATVDPSTGVVTGVSAATTTMTYTLGTGCYRTTAFTVKALPPAITTPVTACVGTSINVPAPSTNGRSWSSSTTTVATIGSSTGTMTGVSTGTTTLTYTTTTGCYVTTEATVYALPSAGTITGPTTVIISNTITLNDAAGGGVWSSSSTAKATIGAATGIVTGVAAGSTTISYSVSNPGCTVRATQVVSVTASRPGGFGVATDNTTFQLYPNPTTGAFAVEAEEAGTFNIFSLDGREVSRYNIATGANQLALPKELASGIYMCRFTNESGNTTMVRLVYER